MVPLSNQSTHTKRQMISAVKKQSKQRHLQEGFLAASEKRDVEAALFLCRFFERDMESAIADTLIRLSAIRQRDLS